MSAGHGKRRSYHPAPSGARTDRSRENAPCYTRHHMSHTLRMRRAFVIFLILLFPFNVFALSLSAALAGQAGSALQMADTAMADGGGDSTDADGACDIDPDPDEPPSGAELHYIVGQGGLLAFDSRATAATAPHDAAPHSHAVAPPVKPPRLS
jgi:hypothetical protein